MELEFKSKKLEKECHNIKAAIKSYGTISGKKLHQRIQELKAAESVEQMVTYRIGRCHALTGNLKGKYALDLKHPFRLIFEPLYDVHGESTGIRLIKLLEVKDYHDN